MQQKSDNLQYTPRSNQIHEFQFLAANRQAVDEMYEIIIDLITRAPEPDYILMLVDTTNDVVPPMRHLFTSTQRFASQYKDAPPGHTAILHNSNMLATLSEAYFRTLGKFITGYNSVRLFQGKERETATNWLLNEARRHPPQT